MQRHPLRVIPTMQTLAIPKPFSHNRHICSQYGQSFVPRPSLSSKPAQSRSLWRSAVRSAKENFTAAARDLNRKGLEDEESEPKSAVAQGKESQTRAPWHREGSDLPPIARQRSAGATTKGKLLTTPSRLLKLILPLTTTDRNSDQKDVEPLALLVHPQQPLSYLERLIQSELPSIRTNTGKDKVPAVHFKAEDSQQEEITPEVKTTDKKGPEKADDLDETRIEGKVEKTGKLSKDTGHTYAGEEDVKPSESSNERRTLTTATARKFVRWSTSTEIGDFIRDAAQGKEFAVEIEGAPEEIRVAVPSFDDRTHYLRTRLRKTSKKITDMAEIKKGCDMAAHRGAQRVAMGGAGLLVGYWYVVYRLTFETDLGWDTMEPVTYLVGLSTLICGYLWFLYHNREVSYRSALNLTISRRQTKLYHAKGFDLHRWESLIEEGNALRKEIKAIAGEYDVDWDETIDEKDQQVTEALKQVRNEKKARSNGDKKEDGGGED